jgi:hypothetical protein
MVRNVVLVKLAPGQDPADVAKAQQAFFRRAVSIRVLAVPPPVTRSGVAVGVAGGVAALEPGLVGPAAAERVALEEEPLVEADPAAVGDVGWPAARRWSRSAATASGCISPTRCTTCRDLG